MEHENNAERVLPLRPDQLLAEKVEIIPDEVFTVFNGLIAENARRGEATVKQFDAVGRLVEMGFDRREIYDKKWLDIEDIYRAVGWTVVYDRPGYNETYEPFFVFTAPKERQR